MLVNDLKDFLQSPDYSRWIFHRKVKVYVRKSTRYLRMNEQKPIAYRCLDIANIEVSPKYQRQGIFKKVLQTWINYNPFPVVFIENVLNEDLYAWLMQQPHINQCEENSRCFFILDDKNDPKSSHT